MTGTGADWRVLDGVTTAWFGAPSLTAGAALAGHVADVSAGILVDLRPAGVRVRLDGAEHADAVSAAARDLHLAADPGVLQAVTVVLESVDPSAVVPFWVSALGQPAGRDGVLVDPLRRDPSLRVTRSDQPRPLRNRLHLDVVRPAAAVEQADVGPAGGPYGVRHADADGNEVDLVPGGPLGERPGTSDWQVVFSATACYRATTTDQQRDLATAAAALADAAGFPLLVDLRPGLVVLDTGKDQGEADAHGLALDFADLAQELQSAARALGATADPALPHLTQLFLDAADVAAVRAFWAAALGYRPDRRVGLDDLWDPRRLDPVLAFQPLDAGETERRRQRDRLHVELAVPVDVDPARLAAAAAAGGRQLEESPGRWVLADPEGNELVVRST
ncbi:VOC family protein [Microlunatus capsulatus]|uniref:VOC family protein n=1 Tax=Microlunatus capsulatus TaxID=99117 RepID=UPI0031E3ED65